ncbi:tRNA ligase subunit PheS family protein [Phytohabitans kaempferiae]|uniref:FDX-ACB domain-containing protein n=1 Tax=Phytohabitans kaempferiae TaxID=1620943 RepID=A0ABV6M4D3_9ACTN
MTPEELRAALALRDLTDPDAGEHAMQHVVSAIEYALARAWGIPVRRDPGPRIVPVAHNYDRLRYSPEAVTRDRRYSRYVDAERMLRSHTTARVPALLDANELPDVLLSVPGVCYRRDAIDRHHVGEPHQLDLWRIRRAGPPLTEADLVHMIGLVVSAALPGREWHTVPNVHPYTLAGREIYVRDMSGSREATGLEHDGGRAPSDGAGRLLEIGECGLAHPEVTGGPSGLAMGLGLDRLVMLAKGVDDIRLLRSTDPRVAGQMRDLSPYRPVSAMPAAHRDLSLAVGADLDAELLGDRVRQLLGPDAAAVEEIVVRSETGYAELPDSARARMGLRPGQKNVLLRVVLRDLTRTLTSAEANALRDRIYAGLHEGEVYEWAT